MPFYPKLTCNDVPVLNNWPALVGSDVGKDARSICTVPVIRTPSLIVIAEESSDLASLNIIVPVTLRLSCTSIKEESV